MVSISQVSCEHYTTPLGIHHTRPRLSWRFEGLDTDWKQASYDLEVQYLNGKATDTERHHVDSQQSVLVPWLGRDLVSRDVVRVRVRSNGENGSSTEWSEIKLEVALLSASDWTARLLGGPPGPVDAPHRPTLLRKKFHLDRIDQESARLYITAHGCYKAFINGQPVGDHVLAPGWQSYNHRLHYQTFDVSHLLRVGAENVIGIVVGEGWFATRLNFMGGRRNIWGSDLGVLAQLEVQGKTVVESRADDDWEWAHGPIISSEIYDGEVYDAQQELPGWTTPEGTKGAWSSEVRDVGFPSGKLIAAECPPVRVTESIKPKELITTPSGKTILDFGQNLVGWLKIESHPAGLAAGDKIRFSHAEVLENGELGTRPLRHAKAQVEITVGQEGGLAGFEPSFTFHGFRYAQIDGWQGLELSDLTAQVIHTDMERTGWFECSHPLINRVWQNVNWSLRGNFVSIPTDCPQRDERLGWTGDLQTFAETAGFLFDTSSTIGTWLEDLAEEQIKDWQGVVPLVVPNTLGTLFGPPPPSAIWGDVAVLTPKDLYTAFGDVQVIKNQYESIKTWLDIGIKRNSKGLWDPSIPQFGDWLDPKAPPDAPGDGRTDNLLVADAWLVHTTEIASELAKLAGETEDAERWSADAARLKKEYQNEYITPNGRLMSDTQTGLAIALRFRLLPDELASTAADRLGLLVRKAIFQISTGFAGTPTILHVLSENDLLQHAYRMFQEKEYPSLLYPASMGATTIVSSQGELRGCPNVADVQLRISFSGNDGTVCSPMVASIQER